MDIIYLILILSLAILIPKSLSYQKYKYSDCSGTFKCGSLDDEVGYPFYDGSTRPDYCGHPGFKLDCSQGIPHPHITISDQEYNLIGAGDIARYVITVSRNDTWTKSCPDRLTNTTLDFSKFWHTSTTQNITFFYNCNSSTVDLSNLALKTTCNLGGYGSQGGYYLTQDMEDEYKSFNLFKNCKNNIFLPVSESGVEAVNGNPGNLVDLVSAFEAGFVLVLNANNTACDSCIDSGGACGYDRQSDKFVCYCAVADNDIQCGESSGSDIGCGYGWSGNQFACYCPDKTYSLICPPLLIQVVADGKRKTPLLIGISIGGIALLTLLGGCLLYIHQKCNPTPQNRSVEDSLKNYASLVPKRYTYKDIKKITKSFQEKLGEGGYGTVFKGGFKDGRVVAVKVWKQSKGDGQDFINEVMSISRTSHVNVVPLLGFCFEGQKRALIYEFMPNGSLEKFIQGRYFNDNNEPLSIQNLFEIGVGIARGLEYLHRGCNTRIVHFDIKPHNILLDAEFTPKISDFGLAKSMKHKESIISMSGARGTAGYIAPEVILRSFGGVSHKSDVYSFGMMVLEMVGCKKRVNDNGQNSSELYFPQWIYKQLEQGTSRLNCERIVNEEEKELERKMILVGLLCIQTNPMSRPSMSRVVEMLEGKVELLEVPPMPTLASPPRQQQPTDDDSASFLSSSTTTYALTLNC